jgi:hypothetical protein
MLTSQHFYAQQIYFQKAVTDTIKINFQNIYNLSQTSIIPFSEKIVLRKTILRRGIDYNISYSELTFKLSDTLAYSIFDTLYVSYSTLKLSLQKEYKKRELLIKYDQITGDTLLISQTTSGGFSPESIFGSGVEKSGTIVRGFTIGTTKDFTLNSGLRLQLSGKISEDIEIVAALTDENTPIQPEGNTERLEELDKVFIQIKHPNAIGTFGDYQLKRRQGEFGVVDRKLQGLLGEFNYANQYGYVAIASSKGKFNSNSFNGQDGVQGPYRLSGINNERDIIVIAGSEKVFIDGQELRRGEDNDYIIDYSNARITFTPRRLITSASRINVDFEYTDRRFARNFFTTGIESNLYDNKLGIKFQYLREGDDQDSPIDLTLSENDKKILSDAGDDRNKAVKSGVTLAEPDSLGRVIGAYISVDTLISGSNFTYYLYSPGDSSAIYNVSFSYVGESEGDYIRESLGNYLFVGIKQGSYLPIIFLPLPELKQLADLSLEIKPWNDLQINLEYAGSLWDKNRLSALEEKDNFGYARNIYLKLNPKEIVIADFNLGRIGFSYKDRFIQDKFTSADRFNEVEFNRSYNLSGISKQENEQLREFTLNLIPVELVRLNSTYGFLKRGENFKSNRFNNLLKFSDNKTFNFDYNFDFVSSKNLNLSSSWIRQNGNAYYTFLVFKPGLEFIAENRKDLRSNSDSLLTGSLRYNELSPFLELLNIDGFNATAKLSFRQDFLPENGLMLYESKSTAQFFQLNYSGIQEIKTNLSFTLRKKSFSENFKKKGFLDNETILIRSQSKFNFWEKILNGDLFYEVSTQKSARLQKVFVRVEQGTGNFRYLGDLNNNGIADENEFEPAVYDGDYIQITVPTDELFPVIDLRTSTRWKVKYGEIFEKKSFISVILNPLSTETFWRIEENSKEEDFKKIYLLNFSYFQNEKTTIRGSNYFQQDFFLWENQQDLSFRIRFAQTKSLNQFSGGVERTFQRERSLRIRFKMIAEVSNQTDLVNETDNVGAPVSSNRKRRIDNNYVSSDFSYRPEKNIEVGFRIKVGKSEDTYPEKPSIIDLNSQLIRFNLSFLGTGRLRIEVERNELISNSANNIIPFELTGGNQLGKNYYWRLNFDYRLSQNLQATVNYDGRIQGGGKAIHTARAEVRAYF